MWVQRITSWSLWLKKTWAQLLDKCMLQETQWDRMLFLRGDIMLRLGLLCVTLFNLDTLCLTYSDPERAPKDSHMLMEQWSKKGRKVMLFAPFEKAMTPQLKWKHLELASRRLCFVKDERETWRFLTCEFFGSLFVIVSMIDCAGLLPELCWSVVRPQLWVTCKDSLYFLTQQDCAPLSLAYRLVTCHNSYDDSHRLDFESFRQHGISNWAPSSTDSCLVVMMWLCYKVFTLHW